MYRAVWSSSGPWPALQSRGRVARAPSATLQSLQATPAAVQRLARTVLEAMLVAIVLSWKVCISVLSAYLHPRELGANPVCSNSWMAASNTCSRHTTARRAGGNRLLNDNEGPSHTDQGNARHAAVPHAVGGASCGCLHISTQLGFCYEETL